MYLEPIRTRLPLAPAGERAGGWISAGKIYRSDSETYALRQNELLASTREGINQIYIWRTHDGFHARTHQEWDLKRIDTILPDNVILLKSFTNL